MPDSLIAQVEQEIVGERPRYEAPLLIPLGNTRELLAGLGGSVDDTSEGGRKFSGDPG
jgi:hypothetical protein